MGCIKTCVKLSKPAHSKEFELSQLKSVLGLLYDPQGRNSDRWKSGHRRLSMLVVDIGMKTACNTVDCYEMNM